MCAAGGLRIVPLFCRRKSSNLKYSDHDICRVNWITSGGNFVNKYRAPKLLALAGGGVELARGSIPPILDPSGSQEALLGRVPIQETLSQQFLQSGDDLLGRVLAGE
jgi:hypothetical protein